MLRIVLMTNVALLVFLCSACSREEATTFSLFAQISDDEPAGPWRVVLNKDIRQRSTREELRSADVCCGQKLRHHLILQQADTSSIRFSAPIRSAEKVFVWVSYSKKPPEAMKGKDFEFSGAAIDIRLLSEGDVVLTSRAVPLKNEVLFQLEAPPDGADSIEIRYFVRPGSRIPLPHILALSLPHSAGEKDLQRMLALRRSVAGKLWYVTPRRALDRRKFSVALDNWSRDAVALADGDTLDFDLPFRSSWRQLRFWNVGLMAQRDKGAELAISVQENGAWVQIAQWSERWLSEFEWHKMEIEKPTGSQWQRIRFVFRGEDQVVGLAEPIILPASGAWSRKMNLILIDLDTMRADRLGCYGYRERPTSQGLDSLLEEKGFFVFQNAHSPASWTLPATAKFMTSRYLGVHQDEGVPRFYTTLPEVLKSQGYYCLAFTGGGILRTPGFEQGFHDYYWATGSGKIENTFPKAEDWVRGDIAEPFFMFLHTYEPHVPYTRDIFFEDLPPLPLEKPSLRAKLLLSKARRSYASKLTKVESLYVQAAYDGGIRTACDATADFLLLLEELNLWGNTVVIILSDHGEEFWEHSETFGHHPLASLHGELLRIPFMIYAPSVARGEMTAVSAEVTTVDLVPTALDLLGLASEEKWDGVSLLPAMERRRIVRQVPILGTNWPDRQHPNAVQRACVISQGKKFIGSLSSRDSVSSEDLKRPYHRYDELFLLDVDPKENLNLVDQEPGLASEMAEALDSGLVQALKPEPRRLDEVAMPAHVSDGLERQLRALGYVSDSE